MGALSDNCEVRPCPETRTRARLRKWPRVVVLSLGIVVAALAGCTTDSGDGTTTTTTGAGSPSTSAVTPATAQVQPFSTPAYLEPKPVDLTKVAYIDKADLSEDARAKLGEQGFVSTEAASGWKPNKFWQVYEEARYASVPVLVTTDSVLNSFHVIFDLMLQQLEETAFYERAEGMSEALQAAASGQVNETDEGTAVHVAALANEAYFAVGNSLLKGGVTAPERVRDEVGAELALIQGAAGLQNSPILGYIEDYSQYKPRGHYTRSQKLERYFKALMWYGHTAFWINPKQPDVSEEMARNLTRQAALISLALIGETEHAWKAVYEPTSFLVGNADDLTAADLRPAMGVALGSQSPPLSALEDDAAIDRLRAELDKLPAPMILSHVNTEPQGTSQAETERSFRVMGQRYIPDSYAFQQLVWRHVGTEEKKRLFPMGLDAMAVLGSDQAFELLKSPHGQDQYQNWESQLVKVKAQFDTRSPQFWPENIYTGWLDALRDVMAFPPDGAPDVMKSKIWARKSLNAALGSWTELRHDTILYAKQSVVAEGGGDEPPKTVGYVEPYPTFYRAMGDLAAATQTGLREYGLLDQNTGDKLDTMVKLCRTLEGIAAKELQGQTLSQDERDTILFYGGTLEGLEQFYAEDGRTLSPPDEKSPVVADVHSEYINNTALEEGTGYPLLVYVVLEVDGRLQLFTGAGYDYYEFIVPIDKRMNDEEWQAALDTGNAPPRPTWTGDFIVK